MSEGHADATNYPIGRVWGEAKIARDRVNQKIATETTLLFNAMVAVISGKPKLLNSALEKLRNG